MDGDILALMEKTIDSALQTPRLNSTDRAMLGTMRLMIAYFRRWEEDHKKVEAMWPAYKIGVWAAIVLAGANLLFLFNLLVGRVGP